jgi:hypothetical protein
MKEPLVDGRYLMQKYPGKGGWTYVVIAEIPQDKKSRFGWVKVKGFIDDYPIAQYKLMPMGNGQLFLPIKAEIRKKIKKEAGNYVFIQLALDNSPLEIPEELRLCLQDYPVAYEIFKSYSEGEQKSFVDWIYSAKSDVTQAARITKMLLKLEKGLKFQDKLH